MINTDLKLKNKREHGGTPVVRLVSLSLSALFAAPRGQIRFSSHEHGVPSPFGATRSSLHVKVPVSLARLALFSRSPDNRTIEYFDSAAFEQIEFPATTLPPSPTQSPLRPPPLNRKAFSRSAEELLVDGFVEQYLFLSLSLSLSSPPSSFSYSLSCSYFCLIFFHPNPWTINSRHFPSRSFRMVSNLRDISPSSHNILCSHI